MVKYFAVATLVAATACAKPSTLPEQSSAERDTTASAEHDTAASSEREANAPLAVLLVMDRSGSMVGEKADEARNAARESLHTLTRESLFGLIAFDQNPVVVVPMQRARERQAIENSIDDFTAGGGTDVRPALREAHKALAQVEAGSKHIILLSDGQSPDQGVDELVAGIRGDGITISCVGIGDYDPALLERIADEGRVQVAELPSDLSSLFASDIRGILEGAQSDPDAKR